MRSARAPCMPSRHRRHTGMSAGLCFHFVLGPLDFACKMSHKSTYGDLMSCTGHAVCPNPKPALGRAPNETETAAERPCLRLHQLTIVPCMPGAWRRLPARKARIGDPRRHPPGGQLSVARAEASADQLLAGRGPWLRRFGHLLHMPSHLFVRLGRYADAAAANVAALAADRALSDACQAPYEPEHNAQMLVWSANMAGQARARADLVVKSQDLCARRLAVPGVRGRT